MQAYGIESLVHKSASFVVFFAHILYVRKTVLKARFQRVYAGVLSHSRGTDGRELTNFYHLLEKSVVRAGKTHSPAGHSEGL